MKSYLRRHPSGWWDAAVKLQSHRPGIVPAIGLRAGPCRTHVEAD